MGDRIFTLLDRNMDGIISESDFTSNNPARMTRRNNQAAGAGTAE